MRYVLRFLDSKWLMRVGGVATLVTIGLALVGLRYGQAVDLLRGAGWVTLLCFGLWVGLSILLVISWMMRRQPSVVASPAARIAISKGVPGSSRALLSALTRAEAKGREFIAEGAILMPVNNQKAASDLAQGYASFESEVALLIESAKELDERWSLTWADRPSWFGDHLLEGPFSLERLSELVRYMALRNRQLGWMLDFLQGGSDEPVRHARAWANNAEQRRARQERAGQPLAAGNGSQ